MDSDAVEPDPHELFSVAEQSHSIWSAYLEKAQGQAGIAESCFRVEDIIGPTPAFPRGWLEYVGTDGIRKYRDGSSELYLSGRGYWRDTKSSCGLDSKVLEKSLLVGIQEPRRIELVKDGRFQQWPGIAELTCPVEGNYLSILVFAWAYIFSAKWIELQSDQGEMEYVISDIDDDSHLDLEIEVSQDCDALEWWRTITSPGQGWRSTVTVNGIEYQSPWSIFVCGIPSVKVRGPCESPTGPRQNRAPPDFKSALGFLLDFCETYDLYDQCLAALSVAILIPSTGSRLPLPKGYPRKQQHSRKVSKLLWEQAARVPYYMSIGSNTKVTALLSVPFFNPSIACNFVSTWLDPIFEILDPLLQRKECGTFLNVLSLREPSIAPLWLGILILGSERVTMKNARLGCPPVDLIAAAWAGVDLSFITSEPIQKTSIAVRRADECRLLFFLNADYERPPICPWRPFGSIPFDQSILEAQVHISCGHDFKYHGWRWDSLKDTSSLDAGYRRVQPRERRNAVEFRALRASEAPGSVAIPVSSGIASESATRSIFGWLREDGWPLDERHIRGHEWFIGFGDDDSPIGDNDSQAPRYNAGDRISQWRLEVE
jgi:hypothetical protein